MTEYKFTAHGWIPNSGSGIQPGFYSAPHDTRESAVASLFLENPTMTECWSGHGELGSFAKLHHKRPDPAKE